MSLSSHDVEAERGLAILTGRSAGHATSALQGHRNALSPYVAKHVEHITIHRGKLAHLRRRKKKG